MPKPIKYFKYFINCKAGLAKEKYPTKGIALNIYKHFHCFDLNDPSMPFCVRSQRLYCKNCQLNLSKRVNPVPIHIKYTCLGREWVPTKWDKLSFNVIYLRPHVGRHILVVNGPTLGAKFLQFNAQLWRNIWVNHKLTQLLALVYLERFN